MERVLLMTVGTGIKGKENESMDSQGHGIAYTLKRIYPDKIIFLVTEESKKTLDYVEKYLEDSILKSRFLKSEKINLSSYSEINTLIKEISDIFEKNKCNNLVIVPTFGTKDMSISLSIAGVIYNTEIYSVEGDRENGIVVKGTEKVEEQNLWYLKNRFCIEKVKEFFKLYRFDSALDKLEEITKAEEFMEIYKDLKNIIEAYIFWDKFDHKNAFLKLKEFENKTKYKLDKNLKFLEEIYSLRERLKKARERYEKTSGDEKLKLENEIKKLKEKELLYLLFDLYSNALRRLEEKKYDDCMARFYRIIEFIAQFILWKDYNISVSEMFGDTSPCDEVFNDNQNIREKYNIEEFMRKYCSNEKLKIGLEKCYNLLSDMNNDFGSYINKIKDVLFQRNNSILAHGIQPIKKDSCIKAKEKTEELLKKLCEKENCNFEELVDITSFIKEL